MNNTVSCKTLNGLCVMVYATVMATERSDMCQLPDNKWPLLVRGTLKGGLNLLSVIFLIYTER